MDLGGITLGLREGVIALIVLVGGYMLFVLLRMRRLRTPSAKPERPVEVREPASRPRQQAADGTSAEEARSADEAVDDEWRGAPQGLAEEFLRSGLEQEIMQLREEVDAMRGELAALRDDMQHELAQMRASQTVSPIYGDAVQMAAAGYDPAAIAERCGIARAEAELVVALAKNQEH